MLWISAREIGGALTQMKEFFGRTAAEHRRGKWGFENKAFHHLTALAGLGVLATGLMMFARVDTWFWEANPYVFGISDSAWGLVYVLHGLSAVGFVGLLITHIYFAVRPDKFYLTKSMVRGWITREEFLEHYDPAQWPAGGGPAASAPPRTATPVGAGPVVGPESSE